MASQPATLLIVDDEAAVRRLMARSLASMGFSVKEADNGVSALRLLEAADPVHLLISDIHMPVMDGLALAREVRALRPLLPILFVTGRESPGLSGDVLRKPFGPEALLTAVSQILGRAAEGSRPRPKPF